MVMVLLYFSDRNPSFVNRIHGKVDMKPQFHIFRLKYMLNQYQANNQQNTM